MKLSAILCTALLLAAAGDASAANINTTKSNTFKIDGKAITEQDCIKSGGTVSTDKDGNKICTLPQGINLNSSKSN